MATQTTTATVTFAAKASDYRYIRRSQGMKWLPDGNSYNDPSVPEITYQWQHGMLTLERGTDMLEDGVDPENGSVIEQDAVDYLRSRPENGVWYREMDPIIPDAGPLLGAIARAAAQGDGKELVRLGDAEAASYHRDEVLDVIRDALASLEAPAKRRAPREAPVEAAPTGDMDPAA